MKSNPTPRVRPIILTDSEVRAVLNGTKTQHRIALRQRIAGHPTYLTEEEANVAGWYDVFERGRDLDGAGIEEVARPIKSPFGVPGDRLYVKEAHAWVDYLVGSELDDPVCVAFKADRTAYSFAGNKPVKLDTYAWPWDRIKWRSPALMPRWASRLTLVVESVRVQRLQDISEEDALAEGIAIDCGHVYKVRDYDWFGHMTARGCMETWWGMKGRKFEAWVFALTFKRPEGGR